MKTSMISTRNPIHRMIASPAFVVVFSTLAFIFLIAAGELDTSVPDMIATEAQYHQWIEKHGEPGDQTPYYLSLIGALIASALALGAYVSRKNILKNKYWL